MAQPSRFICRTMPRFGSAASTMTCKHSPMRVVELCQRPPTFGRHIGGQPDATFSPTAHPMVCLSFKSVLAILLLAQLFFPQIFKETPDGNISERTTPDRFPR